MMAKAEKKINVTLRDCVGITNALEQLKIMGNFEFRCAVVGAGIAAKRKVEEWNEMQKPSNGIVAFQEEVKMHRENCTKEKDGKKIQDVDAFIPLFQKSMEKHKDALDAADKLQVDANKELNKVIDIDFVPISMDLIKKSDAEERIPANLLASILPFCVKD